MGDPRRASGPRPLVSGQPKDIFTMLRLDQALPIFPTADEALKGF